MPSFEKKNAVKPKLCVYALMHIWGKGPGYPDILVQRPRL